MQCGGIEICSIRPDESMNFGVERHLVEYLGIPQWCVQLTG